MMVGMMVMWGVQLSGFNASIDYVSNLLFAHLALNARDKIELLGDHKALCYRFVFFHGHQ